MMAGRRGRAAAYRVAPWLAVGLIACVGTFSPSESLRRHRTQPVADAGGGVGAEACFDCHDADETITNAAHGECESCHGPGELHAETAEEMDVRFPGNADCEHCHGEGHRTLIGWSTSPHQKGKVLCSDCHDTHNSEPANVRTGTRVGEAVARHASATTRMCASCHPDVTASLTLPSHHPVAEGMLECTDCHRPHGDRHLALGARSDACTGCHESHAGPWIYEHPPVAEDCSYCHAPHGSSTYDLLETTQPGVCISCHTVAESGAVHDPWAFVTRCTDCHGAVHGSYSDPHLMR